MRGWKYKQVGAHHCIACAILLSYAGNTVLFNLHRLSLFFLAYEFALYKRVAYSTKNECRYCTSDRFYWCNKSFRATFRRYFFRKCIAMMHRRQFGHPPLPYRPRTPYGRGQKASRSPRKFRSTHSRDATRSAVLSTRHRGGCSRHGLAVIQYVCRGYRIGHPQQ